MGNREAELPTSFAVGRAWRRIGPESLADLVDLASSRDGRTLLASDAVGGVWLSQDAGITWRVVLEGARGPSASGEEVILDVETRLQELMDEYGAVDGEYIDPDILSQLQADAQSGAIMREQSDVAAPTRVEVEIADDGRLVVARGDGLWVSGADGDDWRQAQGGAASWLTHDGARWAVVLDGELWVSMGAVGWERAAPMPEGALGGLVVSGDNLWSLTAEGLFHLGSDGGWGRVDDGGDQALLTPDAAGRQHRVWFDATTGIDGGTEGPVDDRPDVGAVVDRTKPPVVPARAHAVLRLPSGRYLAATADGVYQWAAGEPGWFRLGGEDGAIEATAVAEVRVEQGREVELVPVLAGPSGMYLLEREALNNLELPPWLTVDQLLVEADRFHARSTGADQMGPGGQALTYLLPQVRLQGYHRRVDGLHSALDAGMQPSVAPRVGMGIILTWSPPRRNLSAASDATITVDEDGLDVYGGDTDNWMMLGRTARQAVAHRLEVTSEVGDLVANRQRLQRDLLRPRVPLTIQQSVDLMLRISEIEARLDVLTNGFVSRYSLSKEGSP